MLLNHQYVDRDGNWEDPEVVKKFRQVCNVESKDPTKSNNL